MDNNSLDIAYKYPFSSEAKSSLSLINVKNFDKEGAKLGKLRVEEALKNSAIEYSPTPFTDLKKKYLLSYIYARMLVSTLDKYSIEKYVRAEASRSRKALESDTPNNLISICTQLDIDVHTNDSKYFINIYQFLANSKRSRVNLVNQQLHSGNVYLNLNDLSKIAEAAIYRKISEGLPIKKELLPKEIFDLAKSLHAYTSTNTITLRNIPNERYSWIEDLLKNPISDVRHRTINLILAPYFVNVLKLDEDKAASEIIKYIEKCKAINPDTDVNERYIRYQCAYAKKRGLSPLSISKAKDMLGENIKIISKSSIVNKAAK
jgi:DNA primase large subunit